VTTESPFALNDELLSAYLDGELDETTRARVERGLADDAGARVRLERMRAADASMRDAFAIRPVSVNDPLAHYIQRGKRPAEIPVRRPRTALIAALAAGVASLIVGIGFTALRNNGRDLVTPRALTAALQSSASGATNERGAQILLTFKAADGRYCRAFRWHAAEGLACRRSERWEVLAWDATANSTQGFQPAGASELIDATMDRLGGDAPLDAATERALIDARWVAR
jgi:hypothetical protein